MQIGCRGNAVTEYFSHKKSEKNKKEHKKSEKNLFPIAFAGYLCYINKWWKMSSAAVWRKRRKDDPVSDKIIKLPRESVP